MTKRFLSLCSGIDAASVAWAPLGWRAAAFSEVAAFPSAVLAHHYPGVPNHGDMTGFMEWPDHDVDVVCGGTPCQSFSVAGLRGGLADPRGNLALTFLAVVDRYRPRWVLWENVPGVLSSGDGRDFGCFLDGLGQLGYGWCFRVLDAQYVRVDGLERAVPQRRSRVFVVGHLGDWRRAAAVLSEPESLLGHSPPSREAGAGVAAGTLGGTSPCGGWRFGPDEAAAGQLIPSVAPTLDASFGRLQGCFGQDLNHGHGHLVAHTLRGEGFDASEDGTGRGTPIVPVLAVHASQDPDVCIGHADPVGRNGGRENAVLAYGLRRDLDRSGTSKTPSPDDRGVARIRHAGFGEPIDVAPTLDTVGPHSVATPNAVRRLTPLECERLQGFPDGYTDVVYRGRPAADGPRYATIGNSWPVNVVRWIGRRIEFVEAVADELGLAP